MTNTDGQKAAIVTGATSGIGRALAIMLAERGWRLALAARREEGLASIADELTRAGAAPDSSVTQATDVANPGQVGVLVRIALERFGRVDALVNNAGYAPLVGIGETDPETIVRSFGVNAIGPAVAIAALWPSFVEQNSGCVVNVSTVGTEDPFPGFFAYASAKASVNLMALSCAQEGRAHGIRAFGVAPGAVETPMLRGLFGTEQIPAEACLAPEDVASLIVSCIEGERDADNGRTIAITREAGAAATRTL